MSPEPGGVTRREDSSGPLSFGHVISAQDLVEQVATIHHWTGHVSTLVEDSHLQWRPRDGALTTGELLLHIANGRLETLDTITFRTERDRGHRLRKRESAARLREVLLRTSERTLAYLGGADLDGHVTNFYGASVPR